MSIELKNAAQEVVDEYYARFFVSGVRGLCGPIDDSIMGLHSTLFAPSRPWPPKHSSPFEAIMLEQRVNEMNLAFTGFKNMIRNAISDFEDDDDSDELLRQLKELVGD